VAYEKNKSSGCNGDTMSKKIFNLFIISCSLVFCGCSSEPSASDISKAVGESFKNDSSLLNGKKLIGTIFSAAGVEGIKLESVDKIGCEPSGKNAYICEVSVEYTIHSADGSIADLLGAAGQKRSISKYRLVSTSKGWVVAQGENQ